MCTNGRLRRGFTLVELLVVITIIGILIALLLPAVQAAREAARKMQCSNNLKQLALSMLQHEQANGKFPSGGWHYYFVGDSTRGFGMKQPGGWTYSILPYMDQLPLFQMSASDPTTLKFMWQSAPSNVGVLNMVQTPLSVMSCPSRRPAVVYPISIEIHNNGGSFSAPNIVKGDYAANAGDMQYGDAYNLCKQGPGSLAEGDSWTANPSNSGWATDQPISMVLSQIPLAWGPTPFNGIVYQRSEVTMGMIQDGTSNTFLVGEKYVTPNFYTNSQDTADSETYYNGDDNDNQRSGWSAPMQDTPDYYPGTMSTVSQFGSAHDSGVNMAFCDGSVHMISYTINSHIPGAPAPGNGNGYNSVGQVQPQNDPPGVFQRLANRQDGWSVDQSQF